MDTKNSHVNTMTEPNPEFVIIVNKSNKYSDTCRCCSFCIICILTISAIVITSIVAVMLRKEN